MSSIRQPIIPQGETKPNALERFTSATQELVRSLVSANVFASRVTPQSVIRNVPTSMPRAALQYGALNRVQITANDTVVLPRLDPKWIGHPVYLAKLSNVGVLKVLPGPRTLGSPTLTIDGMTSRAYTAAGLYTLMQDGERWYANEG